ncbi:hypothetical protein H4R26_003127 [Coemansia thaxteri]|uniref:Uncharacterized protein n=1 Tax=Coemansia thaxteri TaxID=2663907 RepID=A0A9W8EEY8_9FUNG|nr:hypothetical protein H4R26_003127 [Coemansia thaxteri]
MSGSTHYPKEKETGNAVRIRINASELPIDSASEPKLSVEAIHKKIRTVIVAHLTYVTLVVLFIIWLTSGLETDGSYATSGDGSWFYYSACEKQTVLAGLVLGLCGLVLLNKENGRLALAPFLTLIESYLFVGYVAVYLAPVYKQFVFVQLGLYAVAILFTMQKRYEITRGRFAVLVLTATLVLTAEAYILVPLESTHTLVLTSVYSLACFCWSMFQLKGILANQGSDSNIFTGMTLSTAIVSPAVALVTNYL